MICVSKNGNFVYMLEKRVRFYQSWLAHAHGRDWVCYGQRDMLMTRVREFPAW